MMIVLHLSRSVIEKKKKERKKIDKIHCSQHFLADARQTKRCFFFLSNLSNINYRYTGSR